VLIVVHFTSFSPHPSVALRRMQRTYEARARDVASDVADLFGTLVGTGDPDRHRRAERKLQRHLLRLNEAALLIESRLVNRLAIPDEWSAAALHHQLFEAELALSNVARFAVALARGQLPGPVNELVGQALAQVRDSDHTGALASAGALQELLSRPSALTAQDRILLHRFATSVTDFSNALRAWLRPVRQVAASGDEHDDFQTQVLAFGPWLPGSAFVSGNASIEPGRGLAERVRMAPYVRVAIQVGVAVSGALIAGDALSSQRFYWAVIAAFLALMGTNTAGEQLRKGFFRIVGTFIGVIVGSALAQLAGDRVGVQIVVALVAIFFIMYLFRINFAFVTIAVTVLVSQVYVELNEFSNSLLLPRLEETAVGAAIAMATVLLVFPLHIGRVVRVAARRHLEALADLIDRCLDRLLDPASGAGSDLELRAAARRLDNTYQALIATVRPMRTPLFGRPAQRISRFLRSALAARHYARDLILDVSLESGDLSPTAADELSRARQQLAASVASVTAALRPDGAAGQYVRSASLFDRVADTLPEQQVASRPQLALRDLELLDGALAEAAHWAGVPVADLDTASRPGLVG
jgi:gas vesicle protein